jgi:hypothetical protein
MAYKSRHRRRALGKRQVEAVKAIVRNTHETKIYWDYITPTRYLFTAAPGNAYLSDRTGRYLIPVHANIPKIKNTLTESNISVIGDEFYSVGISIKLFTIVTGSNNYRIRATVFSSPVAPNTGTGPFGIGPTNSDWLEQQTPFFQPTLQSFSDGVNVLKSRTIGINEDGGVARSMKMYVPIKGRKETYKHESATINSTVGTLTGRNYYLMIEWYSTASAATSNSDNLNILGEFRVYFKDA